MDLQQYILEVIRGERRAPFLKLVLRGIGNLYRSIVALRNFAYDRNIFPSHALSVPVISVGNIAVGGTGKTPCIQLLCSHLQEKMRLAILTRGYCSRIEKEGRLEKINPQICVKECGDEPYLLAQKTKAAVWVGADRVASGKKAIEEGAQCLLLDDGFQHRRLRRAIDIVMIDANNPFSGNCFLPSGLLRDSPQRLKQADLIVANHVRSEEQIQQLHKQLKEMTDAPVVAAQVNVLHREKFFPAKVGVFCGIGTPERFLQTVRDLNQDIVETLILKDHQEVSEKELEQFAAQCQQKGARFILCTEKDAVKCPFTPSLEMIPVAMELKIISGQEHWDNLIQNIIDKVK